tara:strand:+ start:27079 stop:27771 length:693 start_codon:yes stop_codon:yes gene_type:complete
MKRIAFTVITLMIAGCSTQVKNDKPMVSAQSKSAVVKKVKKIKKTPTTQPKVIQGKLNIDTIIKKQLGKSWDKNNYWFDEIDNKNGYAKMGFFGEGYDEYFLFVSDDKSLLIRSSWGCGPACTQTVSFYTYQNNEVRPAKFVNHFKAFSDKYSSEMKNCIRKNGILFNEESHKIHPNTGKNSCDIMFDFPKFGTTVSVYQASVKDEDKFEGALKEKLKWNKKTSQFYILK